jgi:hypothetical protein
VVSVWDTGFRPWTEIRQRYEHGIALLKQTHHWYLVAQTHIALSYFHIFHGEWEAFIAINIFLYEGGLRRHHQDHISWAISGRGMLALRRQQNQLARGYFQYLVDLALTHKFPPVVHLMGVSGLALISCHEEDWDTAEQQAKHAASLGSKLHNIIFPMYDGYANLVEARIRLWERALRLNKQVAPARQAAYRDLKLFNKYTRLYPIGQPAQAHFQGWMAYLDGQEKAALRFWAEGLQQAATHHMPYEELQIRQTRRRLIGDGYPQQKTDEVHIQQLAEQLSALTPVYELDTHGEFVAPHAG